MTETSLLTRTLLLIRRKQDTHFNALTLYLNISLNASYYCFALVPGNHMLCVMSFMAQTGKAVIIYNFTFIELDSFFKTTRGTYLDTYWSVSRLLE